MPEEKKSNKERLKEITDSIEAGIKELFESEKYQQYLQTMSRFHRYSVNNTMLIYMQKPDATLVAGFNKWRDQFERNVNKGEHGIKIIAPTPYKKKIEEQKLDPDTRLPMLDADGKVIMEEKEIKIPMYKPVTVFDVSQTSGKPLPQLANDLSGNVQDYEAFMEAIRRASPVPIEIKPIARSMDGFFSPEDQSITLREGMSEVQTVCAAIHEIAHSKLHNYEKQKEAAAAASENAEPVKKKDRRTEEVEAESISYSVCAYYGIATGENSFGYIATWSKDKELPELRASLETINKTASELITDIDRSYAQLMKEREAEKGSREQAVPDSEPEVTMGVQEETQTQELKIDPAISVDAMNAYGYTDENMQPLSKEQALELYERDVPVYMLYTDNTESMAFDAEEIRSHDGFFGVSREDWEAAKMGFEPEVDRPDYEKSFLDGKEDGFLLLQLKDIPETRDFRFMDMEYLRQKEMQVSHDNYGAVYSGSLPPGTDSRDALDNIYTRFNIDRPQDFTGHSLSVSDIIVLRQQGRVSCHYVDSWGFKELPQFLPENYLKNAEMAMEDDYGMIDGIINNGKSPARVEQERQTDERPSVLEKLRSYSTQERTEVPKKNAPSRGAEREI